MGKHTIASIVTYNPDISRLRLNIESIFKQVKEIIIVDNGSKNLGDIQELLKILSNKFSTLNYYIIINKKNNGIAVALNQALNYAKSKNFEWILTLDQDSVCDINIIYEYKKFIKYTDNIAIISPEIIDKNINIESYGEHITYPLTVITSGSLTNVKIASEIGGFIDKLFIDYVDFEFCLRLIKNGYKILRVRDAKLYHQLGDAKTFEILNLKIISTNHSYIRRYYFYRNSIYVYKYYIKYFPKWVIRDILSKIKTMIIIVLFERNKVKKIQYSIKGIYDGILDNYERNF